MTVANRYDYRKWLGPIASVVVLALALVVLARLTHSLRLRDILDQFYSIPWSTLLLSGALAAGSYLVLTSFEVLAVRNAGRSLGYVTPALTSFVAYAVGHNVGLATLSGGAVRYRSYSLLGLSASEIAQIVAFSTLTFALGTGTLLGITLVRTANRSATLLHLDPAVVFALGLFMLCGVAAYVLLTVLRKAPFEIRGWQVKLPSPGTTGLQLVLSMVDLTLVSGSLYVLLPPEAQLHYVSFVALYLIGLVAGVVSTVPGGLGVFESVLLLLMPDVPTRSLLGSLLAFRVIYYVLPFLLSLAAMVGHEAWRHRATMLNAGVATRRWLASLTPQGIALMTFAGGVVLLFSGATPALDERLRMLHGVLPLPVLELSHLVGSAAGVGLLILARGLSLRLDGAWHVTLWVLVTGIFASLLKGLDYEEAVVLSIMLAALVSAREQFHRRASFLEERFSAGWSASVFVAIATSIWLGLIAHRHVAYNSDLWWRFAFDANAPRVLRASLLVIMLAGFFGLWRLLRPARPRTVSVSEESLAAAESVIGRSTDSAAHLALLGDKHLLFSERRNAFIMYGISGRSWVAMGDPIGPPTEFEELAWDYRERCDRFGAWPVFYQVSPDHLPLYVDLGLGFSKLGEEARVNLGLFSLDGSPRAHLRQSHRKVAREGVEFSTILPGEVARQMGELKRVSDSWLASRHEVEKGFSLGFFSERYLSTLPAALVRREGRIVAFANLWETAGCEELSVDLMRYADDAPKGVMDFLFVELMLWGKARGYKWFNLGMAPLAGLEDRRLAPAWHKFGRLVYRWGDDFYNFEGLKRYKEKFLPEWRPRFLAAPGGLALPRILLDVTGLISGGSREIIPTSPTAATAA
ncbi:MAG TPA: bifunctional lysylphosphatidylglycerol flippase/synthetase MprF [Steroidobacteraceae bacterium]|nr:bifunctional lysylphosphatidylglycerol flippase/synthetase MprF [Steroidobacteraceae bacterium]